MKKNNTTMTLYDSPYRVMFLLMLCVEKQSFKSSKRVGKDKVKWALSRANRIPGLLFAGFQEL